MSKESIDSGYKDDLDNLDFFNDDNITKQLKKRHSINETPIINS